MDRSALRPGWICLCTLRSIGAAPISLAPPLVVASVMVVAASVSPAASSRPFLFVFGSLLSWAAAALSVQFLACGYWRMCSGQRLPISAAFRSLRPLAGPLALAAFWASLLIVLGVAVFVVGAAVGAALSLWVLFAAAIEGLSGRAAVDRAWALSGMSGVMWATICLIVAGSAAWVVALGLSRFLGPSAAAALPALVTLLAVPPVFAAFLSRRS